MIERERAGRLWDALQGDGTIGPGNAPNGERRSVGDEDEREERQALSEIAALEGVEAAKGRRTSWLARRVEE